MEVRTSGPALPLVPEDWAYLPSVLVYVFIDSFDSEEVVGTALSTDKTLIALWVTKTTGTRESAQWALDLSWEFVHNPKLAVMIFERSDQVIIRTAFIREVAGVLGRRTARAHALPLTFEQLNQPDPVWQAVDRTVFELTALAEQRGWTSRVMKEH